MSKAPEPGVYRDIPFDDYARWDAVNHSILRHFRKTPAHAYWEMTHQEESTPFQALGHFIHFAVLEPERFSAEGPVVAPDVDRRTRVGKAEWAEFCAAHPGRPVVTAKDFDTLVGIQASIARHATAREALYGFGASELSIVWDEPLGPVTNLIRSKIRIDRLCEIGGYPTILDIKTMSKPASTEAFQKAVFEYGYHTAAAFYLRGATRIMPPDEGVRRKFVWLACETEPPYCVRMFEADDAAIDIGQDEIDKYLTAYLDCRKANVWPGWPEGMDLAGLPAWAMKRYDLE